MQNDSTIQYSRTRAAVAYCAIGALLAGLVGRVAYLQTYGRQQTILKAERQHHQNEVLPARRGSIFDRNGMLMACTVQNAGVFVDPQFMHERYQDGDKWNQFDGDIRKLAGLLEIDADGLSKLLSDQSEERFVKLTDCVDEKTAEAVRKLDMPGVGLVPVNHRVYPMGSLGAHVIGGVGKDQTGLEGLEMKYDKLLNGKDGRQRILKDAKRRGIGVAEEDFLAPEHGQHLVLTIDANIQMIAEQELVGACEKFRAKRGEVVVLDPWTGDVLALANYPTFNPQMINEAPVETRRDNTLVSPYEPGSAIKPFIVGPALTAGTVTWNMMWPVHGGTWFTPYGREIADVHGAGVPLTTWDVLVKSSNIGMAMISEHIKNPGLHKGLASFGFGKTTGIELPGEDPGLLRPLKDWGDRSTDSVAQGYELMVTPLQLAHGFCAYANGGRLPEIRLIRGVLDTDGNVVSSRARPNFSSLAQPVSTDAAAKIRRILADVPLRGTANSVSAKIPGTKDYVVPTWYLWNIFGKTGTAHISEGKKGYSLTRFNSTFMGGAPYENPKLVIAMTLHEPDPSIAHYGGTVSGPAAARILGRSLEYLQLDPSPELPLPPADIAARLVRYDPAVYHKPTTRPTSAVALGH